MKRCLEITKISRAEAGALLDDYHYLSKQGNKFRSGENFGLFDSGQLIGCCVFTGFPVAELFKGIWGIDDFRSFDQKGFWELSRLVISPMVQFKQGMHSDCTASWFLSRCLRLMRNVGARAILSYADSDHHRGTVYAACNFEYYGLTKLKYNIWIPSEDGVFLSEDKRQGRRETHWKQMTRGWRVHLENGGIKIPRGRKHRFLIRYDKEVRSWPMLWKTEKWSRDV
tara:strand:- start:1609 stop:2286 length:678 start_codon:yes stop_codon:yes gene_type:complete